MLFFCREALFLLCRGETDTRSQPTAKKKKNRTCIALLFASLPPPKTTPHHTTPHTPSPQANRWYLSIGYAHAARARPASRFVLPYSPCAPSSRQDPRRTHTLRQWRGWNNLRPSPRSLLRDRFRLHPKPYPGCEEGRRCLSRLFRCRGGLGTTLSTRWALGSSPAKLITLCALKKKASLL